MVRRATRGHRATVVTLTAVIAAGAVAVPVAAAAAPTCTITWTASGDGAWTDAINWTPARVPAVTDQVCLPPSDPVKVALGASTKAGGLQTGDGTVVVAPGAVLTLRNLTLDGTGGFSGAGAVRVQARGDRITTTIPSGAMPALAGGFHLLAEGTVVLTGQLGLTGGSTFRTLPYLFASPGASITDDGDPNNLVVLDQGIQTGGSGQVTIAPPVRLGEIAGTANLRLLQLVGASPDGTTTLPRTYLGSGTLVVPYPISTLVGGPLLLFAGAAVIAQSTGRSALAPLTRVNGYLDIGRDFTSASPITVDGRGQEFGGLGVEDGTTTIPAVTLTGGAGLAVSHATLRLGADHTGVLTLCSSTTDPCVLDSNGGGLVDGSVQQRGGTATFGRATRITGDWTSNATAHTEMSQTPGNIHPGVATNVAVSGTAHLAGTLTVDPGDGSNPAVGTQQTLLTAAGGLTASFSQVTAPPGWRVKTTATAIVATYTG